MDDTLPEIPQKERLTEALKRLLKAAGGEPLAIREMIEILHGRGMQMIIVLLCVPFLTPVAIPGISIPFGLAIIVIGLRIAFGHKPWLPDFILNRHVSYSMLEKMVRFAIGIYGRVERVIRPRFLLFLDGRAMTMLIGLAIALGGLFLSLPIPPPFPLTNTIPGFAIILLSLGIMERDGILILLGYVLTVVAALYVILIALLGTAGVRQLWRLLYGE